MNCPTIKTTAAILVCPLIFCSCEVLSGPEGAAMLGVAAGMAARMAGLKPGQAALVGAAVGGIAYLIGKHYRATEAQRLQAARRGDAYLARETVRQQMRKRNVRYVAVPVSRKQSEGGSSRHLMKVNAETGEPTGDVYVPKAGATINDGQVVKLGGDETLYYGSVIHGI